MKRNPSGALISVKDQTEISGRCFCNVCLETFMPTFDRDACVAFNMKDSQGEMPIICERCFDKHVLRSDVPVRDFTGRKQIAGEMPPTVQALVLQLLSDLLKMAERLAEIEREDPALFAEVKKWSEQRKSRKKWWKFW